MYGAKSWSWCRSTLAYAVSASKCDASMPVIRLHAVSADGVTSCHDAPSSVVTWMSPSSVPIQISGARRSEEHTSELQSLAYLVCRLLLEKKKKALITAHVETLTNRHKHNSAGGTRDPY